MFIGCCFFSVRLESSLPESSSLARGLPFPFISQGKWPLYKVEVQREKEREPTHVQEEISRDLATPPLDTEAPPVPPEPLPRRVWVPLALS